MTLPNVTIVGLGPGDNRYITAETLHAIETIGHRFVRTTQHPSAHLAKAASSFDDVYRSAESFDDVYATIVERLVAAAQQHGHVLYAVPGSPLILERTVRTLRADERVDCHVLPAMSFLDLAYAALDIDPVETGVRLVDGHEFATAAAGYGGPMLIAHTHANWVLSDIKLAVEDAAGNEPVVILQRLGTADQQVVHTTWADLDRAVDADHLTCVFVPGLGAPVGSEMQRFHHLVRTLRDECPWDREQTHASLVRYLVEEAFETVDALEALDPDDPATDDALVEELGDLLYQIEFHATIAEQAGRFSMADVARNVHDKLVRRHPHVFGSITVAGSDEVVANWDAIKRAEKQRTSVFDGVPTSQPALTYAEAIQRKAAKVGFDWPDVDGALPKIAEEAAEVVRATQVGSPADVRGEIGDLLFAVVNVARHLGIEPETALRAAVGKFRRRFEAVEAKAALAGTELHVADLATLDAWWNEVKADETA